MGGCIASRKLKEREAVSHDELPEIEEPDPSATRHYKDDVLAKRQDPDEKEQDEILDLDQTELEELGLVLDDPHDPGLTES
jgi:hypothetical protein